jgi:branched-chain amino acid aminotransferase
MKIRYDLKPAAVRRRTPFRPRGPLSFGQLRTDHMFLMDWADGAWRSPRIVPYGPIPMAPGAVVLHYAQEIFEGAKAFRHADGEIRAFRIDRNAERLNRSAPGVCMPTIPPGDQIQAILALLDVERLWCPEQAGASLYIRPFMIGTQDSLGVKPSTRYLFCVFLSPSGPYYSAGFTEPVKLLVTRRFHRAAPGGTGAIKTGGNYAASLRAGEVAHELGAAQVLYLDTTDTFVEEAGAMNHFHVTRHGRLLIPTFTDSILRSVTSESVIALGAKALGVEVAQERIRLDAFLDGIRSGEITEAGGLGTAAVVSPVGAYLFDDGRALQVGDGGIGPVTRRVYQTITDIQLGRAPAPEGWLFEAPRVAGTARRPTSRRRGERRVAARQDPITPARKIARPPGSRASISFLRRT